MPYLLGLLLLSFLMACEPAPNKTYKATTAVEIPLQSYPQEFFNQEKDSLPSTVVSSSQAYADRETIRYVAVPSFTIKIRTTAKVKKLLSNNKEKLVVVVSLFGLKKDKRTKNGEEDRLYLLKKEYSISDLNTPIVVDEQISKEALEDLQDQNYTITIDAYSGRKSSPNNLFHTTPIQGTIATFEGTSKTLEVSLLNNNKKY